MRKVILVALLLLNTAVFAQRIKSSAVPNVVKEKFTSLYPAVKNVKWEKEKGNYEANFTADKKTMSVLIDGNGTLVETETDLNTSELPTAVINAVNKRFPGARIKEAAKIIDNKGKLKYEAEVKGKDYLFDENGNSLN